jgi:hypothetical protein
MEQTECSETSAFKIQILIICSALVKYFRKKSEYNEAVHQLFIDFKRACDSLRRKVLYNILIEFGISMKLLRLIKMCLNEKCSSHRSSTLI